MNTLKRLLKNLATFWSRYKKNKVIYLDAQKRQSKEDQYINRLLNEYKLIMRKESKMSAKNRRRVVNQVEEKFAKGKIKLRNVSITEGKDWSHCGECKMKTACTMFGCAHEYNKQFEDY